MVRGTIAVDVIIIANQNASIIGEYGTPVAIITTDSVLDYFDEAIAYFIGFSPKISCNFDHKNTVVAVK